VAPREAGGPKVSQNNCDDCDVGESIGICREEQLAVSLATTREGNEIRFEPKNVPESRRVLYPSSGRVLDSKLVHGTARTWEGSEGVRLEKQDTGGCYIAKKGVKCWAETFAVTC